MEESEERLDAVQGIARAELDGKKGERKGKHRAALIFTTSRWQAIAHLSGKPGGTTTAIESGRNPDPYALFPTRVTKQLDYGVRNAGLEWNTVEYVNARWEPLGSVLFLYSGKREVACYAVRYDERTRYKDPAGQTGNATDTVANMTTNTNNAFGKDGKKTWVH